MEEDKIMAQTTSNEASAPSPNATKKQRKKQAKKEARTMLQLAQAQKDAKKAELKVAKAQAKLEASKQHTHALETRLEEMRNHSQKPAPVTEVAEPTEVAERAMAEQDTLPQTASDTQAEPIAIVQDDASGIETLGNKEPEPSVVEEQQTSTNIAPSGNAEAAVSTGGEGETHTNGHAKVAASAKPAVASDKSATKPAVVAKKPVVASDKSATKAAVAAKKPPVRSTVRRTQTSSQTPAKKTEAQPE
jgi:hypothetical protein